ncbi:hypothetical protein [Pseudoalteromonas luteoviolacea]|uniref:Uncharacterized protein n=1 Tax=Pseudoalteromonas luteoviolacea DSM 6061 TaxID=1365250 RepID=A0A166XXQ2_9GAMM|nr:hypothetical protein [Pseudoalteromonas luteoviolacea]KZN41020.1 hypothetical protein N475_01170 [Pseudoalteromonas luteoviolacea DSM 6061]KZN56356.1 hypothetical protein N474_11465 [Pseudoalteromonas luteoviolacea CPMOR-2]MBE0386262.1 hypothetical protein [Pseudoalteromonas luteoviolacea DSM 6061]TQF71147.1 hypothetical protein FLM44_08675 [Pseudoalteromonas luteoviolacea]
MGIVNYQGYIDQIDNSDPVVSEINWFIREIYLPAHKRADKSSKATRTLAVLFSIWAFTLLGFFAIAELSPHLKIFTQNQLWDGYDFNWIVLAALPSLMLATFVSFRVYPFKRADNTFVESDEFTWRKRQSLALASFNLIFVVALTCAFTKPLICLLGISCVAGFLLTYMSNRLFGFTASSIRNQTMVHHLRRLKREYEIARHDAGAFEVDRIQAETFKRLFSMVENMIDRRDREILGDHYKVHNSAFDLVKGLKK